MYYPALSFLGFIQSIHSQNITEILAYQCLLQCWSQEPTQVSVNRRMDKKWYQDTVEYVFFSQKEA